MGRRAWATKVPSPRWPGKPSQGGPVSQGRFPKPVSVISCLFSSFIKSFLGYILHIKKSPVAFRRQSLVGVSFSPEAHVLRPCRQSRAAGPGQVSACPHMVNAEVVETTPFVPPTLATGAMRRLSAASSASFQEGKQTSGFACVCEIKIFFSWDSHFLNKYIYLFIYLWLRWVFVAACGLSLVAVSKGYSSLRCAGFSMRWLLLLWTMGSRRAGFSSCGARTLERRLSRCGSRA